MMHTRSQVCALATVLLAVSACTVSSEDQPSPIDGFAGAGGQGASAGAAGAGGQGATAGAAGAGGSAGAWKGLLWPIDCTLGSDCEVTFPDTDGDGKAFDCGAPGYTGHQGTDISVTWDKMDQGTAVYAAESGVVQWVFDGHFDRCPSSTEPSCQAPTLDMGPTVESGYMVCTDGSDAYCVGTKYTTNCFFFFYGSNLVVIRHPGNAKVFATRYDHLRRDSIVVKPGQTVARGDKIAEVGSAGNSTGPHLHFEVWAGGFYVLADPWAGPCGPNQGPTLWENQLTTP